MCLVAGNRYAVGLLEGILNHLVCNIIGGEAGFILANSFGQVIIFLHVKEN
jgi:hypothetical protein